MSSREFAPSARALRAIAVGSLAAGAAIAVGGILNHFAFDSSVADLDAGQEETLNNWLTTVGSFGAALGAFLLIQVMPERRRALVAVAAILALISLDDAITLHERISDNVGIDHIETVIFAPLYAYALFLIWRLSGDVAPLVGRLLRLALVLLAVAIVVDLGSTYTMDLAREGTDWAQPTRIALEEGFEVAGWLLMSGALLALVYRVIGRERAVGRRGGEGMGPELKQMIGWIAVIAGALTLGAIVNHLVLDDRIPDLHATKEATLHNWITVLASFTAALGAALYAVMVPTRRRLFVGLSLTFLFFSIDDQIRIHERVGDRLDSALLETALFGPIFAAAFVLAWVLAPAVGARAAPLMRIGVLLLACAIGLDFGTDATRDLEADGITWPQDVRASFEEGFEVAGWLLIASAFLLMPLRRWAASLGGNPELEAKPARSLPSP